MNLKFQQVEWLLGEIALKFYAGQNALQVDKARTVAFMMSMVVVLIRLLLTISGGLTAGTG